VTSGEWREKDKKRVNTEDTEEAQRTQRRVEEFKVEEPQQRQETGARDRRSKVEPRENQNPHPENRRVRHPAPAEQIRKAG
jgi:hypothetical protein